MAVVHGCLLNIEQILVEILPDRYEAYESNKGWEGNEKVHVLRRRKK